MKMGSLSENRGFPCVFGCNASLRRRSCGRGGKRPFRNETTNFGGAKQNGKQGYRIH